MISSIPDMLYVDSNTVTSDAKFAVYAATNIKLKIYKPIVNERSAAVVTWKSAPYPNNVPIQYHIHNAIRDEIDLSLNNSFSCRPNKQIKKPANIVATKRVIQTLNENGLKYDNKSTLVVTADSRIMIRKKLSNIELEKATLLLHTFIYIYYIQANDVHNSSLKYQWK